jgi:HSP20 family protein
MRRDDERQRCALFIQATGSFRETHWRPRADVYAIPQGWLIKLDIAGVRREDLELAVRDGRFIVRGIRRDFCVEEGCRSYLMEIPYSRFERIIEVPCRDTSEFELNYREGMLLVRIYTEDETS